MRGLGVVLLLGSCWMVNCDLLDLYVQHMDETMKTTMYEKNHAKNLARNRIKRNVVPVSSRLAESEDREEVVAMVPRSGLKKIWEEDRKKFGGSKKHGIVKNDGLEFQNDREENQDSSYYEHLAERLEISKGSESGVDYKGKVQRGKKLILKKKKDARERAEDVARVDEDIEMIESSEASGKDDEDFRKKHREAVEIEGPEKFDVFTEIVDDEDLDEGSEVEFEIVGGREEEGSSLEKSGLGPSLKRHPNGTDRMPKKYSPTAKELYIREKLTGKKSTTDGSSSLANNKPRTKRSTEEKRRFFPRREELDARGDVVLEWDPTDEDVVVFRVTARTLGYVGIGFNDKSHMKGADILLGWIDDETGNVNLLDSHGIEERNSAPLTDVSQDASILDGTQNDTHTTITFLRKWHTCDPEDRQLGADTVHVLWALHETDPQLNNADGHGERRGGRALRLKAPAPHPPPKTRTSEDRTWDIKLNQFSVTDKEDTIYWCKIFKAPQVYKKKHHMIGYTPLIEPANDGLVHHIILYECAAPIPEGHAKLAGAACYSGTMPKAWESCLQPVLAWARGSRGEWFPNHVGIPIAEHGENSYYMLEVHYNNPGLKRVVDSSGVRLHLTPNLRPQEAGILVAGVAVSPLHMVPPRQKEYATAGYCTPDCTNTTFPADGINVISVVLHSHLAGKRLGLKHIRQGKELPRIAQDNHFDFNYQQSHTLEKEVKVLPGDELVAECVYGTLDRANPTLGGYAATQEMCLAFMLHYPRTQLAGCYSMTPVKSLFETLGVERFKNVTFDDLEKIFASLGPETFTLPSTSQHQHAYAVARLNDDRDIFETLVIDKPDEFHGRTLADHMLRLPWTEELLAKSIERNLYHGKHVTYCRSRDDKLAVPTTEQMFPNFTALPEVNDTSCSFLDKPSSCNELRGTPIMIAVIAIVSQWRLLVRF